MSAVQALAVVLIRLWAVGYIIVWLFSVANTAGMLFSGDQTFGGAYGYLTLASVVLILAFWTVVLCYSKRVTLWVVPPVQEADRKLFLAPEELIRIGTFLIGVYYLTRYVPDLLQSAPTLIMQYTQGHGVSWAPSGLIQVGTSLIAILISLWLVLRPGHVARLFALLRQAGQARVEPVEEAPKAE